MRRRRAAIGTTIVLVVAIALIVSGTVAYVRLGSLSVPPSARAERSGPLSNYPALWTDACRLPVQGNATTNNEVVSQLSSMGPANVSLSQIYSKIVSSANFTGVSKGLGWVTTYWGLQDDSGPSYSYEYVIGQFVLLAANKPSGYVQANYNLQTTEVTVDYSSGLSSSCPASTGGQGSASIDITFDRPSPAYYSVGDPVHITFSVVDNTIPDMSVTYPTSGLGSFTVLQGGMNGTVVYDSAKHAGCSGEPVKTQLTPGQTYTETQVWNQTNDAGVQVPTGDYEVMGVWSGSPQNSSSPIGELYVGTPLSPANASVLQEQFYYQGNLGNGYVSLGQPVKIVWVLTNNGQQLYDVEASACSFRYEILNLTNALIFDSAKILSCDNQLQVYPAPRLGGISQISYWNQTDDSGNAVSAGYYRVIIDLQIVGAGREFNFTGNSDLMITTPSTSSSADQISAASSRLCWASCGGSSPFLYSSVDAYGNLTRLQVYLNGTLVGTMSYNAPCCQVVYPVSFNTPIDNDTIPIVPGVSYDIVFVGTFRDGSTAMSFASTYNP